MVIIAIFMVIEIALVLAIEDHYWIIPTVIFFNILVTFLVAKYFVISTFVFSFGQKWVVAHD